MCAGQIIYHGPREFVLTHFTSIGYTCPTNMDLADFLQIIPTPEGIFYITDPDKRSAAINFVHYLVMSWKESEYFQNQLVNVEKFSTNRSETNVDPETGLVTPVKPFWFKELTEVYPGTYWYHLKLIFQRAFTVYKRDKSFIYARLFQNMFIGAVVGSLFEGISVTEVQSMNGFIFFTALYGAFTGFSLLPGVFEQKAVYYKHSASLFYPASSFILSQALVLVPQVLVETIIFCTIT